MSGGDIDSTGRWPHDGLIDAATVAAPHLGDALAMRRTSSITTHTRQAAGLALLLLGVSACGGATAPVSDRSARIADEYDSPIASFLGVSLDASDSQDLYLAAERDRIEWVTTCMAQEGFEYRSEDPTEWLEASQGDPDAPEWGSDAWVATYGFGVSTQMFDQAVVGSDLVGSQHTSYDYVDPNQEYLTTLSDEETTAYYVALYGDHSYEWDSTMTDEENQAAADAYFQESVPTGCEERSYETVAYDDPYTKLYQVFGEDLTSMYERVQSDPVVVKALADISRCASEAGFNFVDESSVYDEIYRRLEPVHTAMTSPFDGFTDEELSALSEEQIRELDEQGPSLSSEGKAILAEVQQYELDLAAAVYGCGYGDMQGLFYEVLETYEQQFIDGHRDELEALRLG